MKLWSEKYLMNLIMSNLEKQADLGGDSPIVSFWERTTIFKKLINLLSKYLQKDDEFEILNKINRKSIEKSRYVNDRQRC